MCRCRTRVLRSPLRPRDQLRRQPPTIRHLTRNHAQAEDPPAGLGAKADHHVRHEVRTVARAFERLTNGHVRALSRVPAVALAVGGKAVVLRCDDLHGHPRTKSARIQRDAGAFIRYISINAISLPAVNWKLVRFPVQGQVSLGVARHRKQPLHPSLHRGRGRLEQPGKSALRQAELTQRCPKLVGGHDRPTTTWRGPSCGNGSAISTPPFAHAV